MFIVQGYSNQPVYIWQGAQIPAGNLEPYKKQADKHVELLQ
jgi:hypothetical protein